MYRKPSVPIEKFGRRSDKNEAVFFVGRKDIIAGIESTVAEIENRIKSETSETGLQPGMVLCNQETWLIQGAPGAGKSALLAHLKNIWATRKNGPVVVEIDPNNLRNESFVTRKIANSIIPQQGAKLLNTVRAIEAGFGVNFAIEAEGKVTDIEQASDLVLEDLAQLYSEDAFTVCKRLLNGDSPKRPKLRPIVVMVDEVQTFEQEDVALLRNLHNGRHGLPILAVLYGLAYSKSKLAAERISRFDTSGGQSHVQTLGALEAGEAAESVHAMLDGYRIKGRDNTNLPEKIGEWCNDWPHHLFHYMVGLVNQLKFNYLDLARVDEAAVRSFGDRCRLQYYNDRLDNSPISDCEKLLADVARLIGPNGCKRGEIINLLNKHRWVEDEYLTTMPEGMKPLEFIEAMVVAGMVHRVATTVTIPIPSFRQYLIDRGE